MPKLYWEDFAVGEVKTIGTINVSRDDITAFAQQYDPQPFHLDEELAKNTFLGRLCASGWHVVTLFARIIYDGYEKETAIVGAPSIEECRWLKPVFPNDTLRCERECLETKTPDQTQDQSIGLCRFRWKLFDQEGTQKTEITGWSKIKKRGAQ